MSRVNPPLEHSSPKKQRHAGVASPPDNRYDCDLELHTQPQTRLGLTAQYTRQSNGNSILKRAITVIPLCVAIALLLVSSMVIREELAQHSWQAIWEGLTEMSLPLILLAIACVGVNYWVMTGYDTLAVRYVKIALPYRKTAIASTISYAISNTIGATFLSGSALRFRFYKGWGLTAPQIAQIIAFCNLSFWLGLLTMGGVLLLARPMDLATVLALPESSVQSLGLFALAIVGAYLVVSSLMRRSLSVGWLSIPRLSFPVAIAQISLTCVDWAIAASTIYILLRPTSIHALPEVIGVYVIAQLAGVLSAVPGGIGIFETVMILLLPSVAPKVELIGALIAFRILHHLLPMGLGVLSLMGYELHQLLRTKRERV